ncbi:hypothetical protein LTR82_016926 [Friedmanniomyces endolithicus]|uniref:ditrans,polycis-polyprenyl diphosphate synthase [(2E,6E)-farnesyldiphosphate specific] n=1 Tax=Friedmanniomyces endolithicus TaxID=329885 RepID=A0AAN6F7K6_9PEZI|nr:hypothetical protein LTR82_016926 [Friedmanniomyces endolithicus]
MPGLRQTTAFRTDRDEQGRPLTAFEREKLLQPYLPPRPQPKKQSRTEYPVTAKPARFVHQPRLRPALRTLLHYALFTLIHAIFSIYIRCRQTYHVIIGRILAVIYYHHRTPEYIQRDVKQLDKVPGHLSVILELENGGGGRNDRLETLVAEACEVAAWSACAGVPMLSIYEKTGALKSSLPYLHRRISKALTSYYGSSSSKPTISLRAPHHPSYSPPHSPDLHDSSNGSVVRPQPHLAILLLSSSDSRQTVVDLTRTLATMAQDNKLSPRDISTELIDAEITESVMGEPDLLIIFGDRILLDGYPPWQIRLTEIYGVRDHGGGVGYSVFLRGLMRYAGAEMRFGR